MGIRFGKKEIRILPLLNFMVLATCATYLFVTSIINLSAAIVLMTDRPPIQAQNGCNGHPALCDRSWSNITHIGAHDSAFVGVMPFENQNVDVGTQLDAGIRFLQVQTRRDHFGQLAVCHTHCVMENAGLLSAYLTTVREWLDTHPKEVVTLLLTNNDLLNMTAYDAAYNVSGMHKYVYQPPQNVTLASILPENWPTLGQLIANETRLITFMDYGSDHHQFPYILPEFSFFWETPFDVTELSAFASCDINRPPSLLNAYKAANSTEPGSKGLVAVQEQQSEFMYIVNHFLDTTILGIEIPDRRDAARTNAINGAGSVGAQVELCGNWWGTRPWGVLVDYFDKGEVIKLQNQLNGIDDG